MNPRARRLRQRCLIAEVAALPMNGRNFLDLALLAPGVAPANIASTQLFPETSAVPGTTLSVGSQRNLSNNFVVDGLSANDDAAGLSGITYGVDAIEQFQVITSGAQAEFGRALGGYVNVVTRSGTNAAARHHLRLRPRRCAQCEQSPIWNNAADAPVAIRRQPRRPDRREPDVLLRQCREARARSVRAHHNSDPNTAIINSQIGRPATAARRWRRASIRIPWTRSTCSPKWISNTVSGHQLSARYSRYDVAADNARGAGGLRRRARPRDWTMPTRCSRSPMSWCSPRAACSRRARNLHRAASRAAHGSYRAGGEHCRRGVVWHELYIADGPLEPHVPGRQQLRIRRRRALASRRCRRSLQRRRDHVSAIHSRRLHVCVSCQLPEWHL